MEPKWALRNSATVRLTLLVPTHAQVIEHVPDPCKLLEDFHRVLRPGGYVMTEFPNQRHHPLQKLVRGQFHTTFFDAASFDRMMTRAGFTRVALESNWPPGLSSRQLHRLGT